MKEASQFALHAEVVMGAESSGNKLQLVVSGGISPERLDSLTRDLARDLTKSQVVRATLPEAPAKPGERGVAAKIGEIFLDLIGGTGLKAASEVASALTDVLKAYFLRERTLKIEFISSDGTKTALDAKNISASTIETVVKALRNSHK